MGKILGFILAFTLMATGIAVLVVFNKEITLFSDSHVLAEEGREAVAARDWDKAIGIYEEGLRTNDGNIEFALALGDLYARKGRVKEAEKLYKDVLTYDPKNIDGRVSYAALLAEDRSRLNDAVEIYRQGLKHAPEDPVLLGNLGTLYKTAAEHPDESRDKVKNWLFDWAVYYYRTALKLHPEQFYTWFNLGYVYHETHHPEKAVNNYCNALMMAPESFETRYNMGLALVELNFHEEGFRELYHAVRILADSGNVQAAHRLAEKVQSIKNAVYHDQYTSGLDSGKIPPELARCLSQSE